MSTRGLLKQPLRSFISKAQIQQISNEISNKFPFMFLGLPKNLYIKYITIEKGLKLGNCKGYYCGHLGKPSGQLSGNPWMVVSHVPEARARNIQFSSIFKALPPQGFVFINLFYSTIMPLLPLVCKVPIIFKSFLLLFRRAAGFKNQIVYLHSPFLL